MTTPDFIGIYPKYFSKEFCDRTIEMFDEAEDLGFTSSRDEQGYPATQVRDSALFHLSYSMNHAEKDIFKEFNEGLWSAYGIYADQYAAALTDNTDNHHVYEAKIQKTRPGQGFHLWHYESGTRQQSCRLLVFMLYLNDVEDGGETEFLYYGKRVKPEAGTLVIWPAGFTHLHRGNPPLNDTKYIITGWFEL
jgi:hypothetical protein